MPSKIGIRVWKKVLGVGWDGDDVCDVRSEGGGCMKGGYGVGCVAQ